jgi:RNase P subunit RPR2|tara:strand:+ start:40 stop:345 length:306 start_codon:yes stop_codon:yes gene_type:complete
LKRKKIKDKVVALNRINFFIDNALLIAKTDLLLAQRYGDIARDLMLKNNIRLPYIKKRFFCKGCKKLIVPGINSKIRIKNKIILTICMECSYIYKKISNTK